MSDKSIPFVITDRRKFNPDGEPRESSEAAPAGEPSPAAAPKLVQMPVSEPVAVAQPQPSEASTPSEDDLPAAPTPEQMEQSERAFQATAERLDLAIRSANPGADHPPALTFESLIQSVYMQAVLQLGGGAQQGEQPQIDLLGARQSIDMLAILAAKTKGNLSRAEENLLLSALFELRLAFLEMTQALARSAAQRHPAPPGAGSTPPGPRSGPSIVR